MVSVAANFDEIPILVSLALAAVLASTGASAACEK